MLLQRGGEYEDLTIGLFWVSLSNDFLKKRQYKIITSSRGHRLIQTGFKLKTLWLEYELYKVIKFRSILVDRFLILQVGLCHRALRARPPASVFGLRVSQTLLAAHAPLLLSFHASNHLSSCPSQHSPQSPACSSDTLHG